MGDIVVSIVAKLAEYTVGPILHHAQYLCCFNNIAGNLPNAKEELELTRNSVKERVEEAIMRTEKIEPAVEKWLKDVEKVLEEVHMLQGRISEVSKSYFRRQFQYFLTKKIARKIEKMAQLNHNSKFDPFSKIAELPGMKYYSSKDFVLFKSRESAFKKLLEATYNKLLEALKDKSVSMIGLVGLGGSGKTTLAKEVGKKAEELKLFEKVVMTTVSQTPNILEKGIECATSTTFTSVFKYNNVNIHQRTLLLQMGDIVVSIVAKLAEYTVDPILHHARYLCCFNNIAGNLPNAKEELELTRNSVKERVEEAIMRTEKIEPAVEKWLKDVEKVLEEVHMLQGRISEVSKSYFRRQFQYFLTKKIARKIEKMAQLNHNSKFEPFSKIPELPGMKYYSSKDFVLFKSRESTYNKLLEALKDKSVSMIGLVGLGGSGKTTLAKEVGKKAEELKLFEKVVMATVSQTPNIRSIQVQIADKLGLKFVEESEEARAQRLSERLRTGTTLLILDDVWENLDFEAIGIPYNENNKGCGVLLTTRSREVCISMQCQTIIELNLLTGEEAWDLFKLNANITDDSPYASKGVATKIVDECRGLPIAIVTVGSTLKGKTFEEWESALSRLEDSKPLDIPKGLRSPYACLQLSYDNLTNQLAKSLFLLCSIFPEDHEIDLEDLFRFGKGMGLPGTFGTMEKARREMQIAVSILVDCYLLLQASEKERVKMHDMVRDVALWIASKTGQAILASTGMDPRMLIEDETIKEKRAISLWDLKNGQLLDDDQLNCPSLEILLFHSPEVGFEVSNACFERLKMIKILAFLRFNYTWWTWTTDRTLSLPQSMESLQNLHTLCLRGYELGDISILESLQALEVLDLRGSSFIELPNGIASLKKLKLLDLFNCGICGKMLTRL
ncbi:Disease resistance protein [Glycine soja]|uniref:Disease resistance protein n=1 Tax=Glycine soja TaxID=3848 RepID=A0A0B2RAM9_GLYSO|nr:Disease resistance protein [Glycine soja]